MKRFLSGWEARPLSDFVERFDAGVSVNAEDLPATNGDFGVLKLSCVSGGIFNPKENKRILPAEVNKARVSPKKGRIIISRSNTTELVGANAYVEEDYPTLFLPDTLWQSVYREDAVFSSRWLSYVLQSPATRRLLGNLASGTSGSMKKLNRTSVLNIEIITPTHEEQLAIADILVCWDRKIETLEQLFLTKTCLKRGLMQQLLTGRKRFRGFDWLEWKRVKISDFTKLTLRPTPKPDKPFKSLGIRSHGKGTFLKENFEPQKIGLTELYEVKENDLIVNITFAWEGAIAVARPVDSGALVSHRFPTYVFDTERAISEYFRHIIVQKWFVEKLELISPGGAGRNRVLSKKDFAKIEILMPSVDEQKRIAAVLNTCDREIDLLRRQIAALKKQKHGLMQKLLTGQIRVKMENEEAQR
ncbi:MAG: restriction endonuclease subunit S [Acidobacteria bacterium]|nr:restriction endonuclease subunit S [Acidobacteriota bacterium]